MPQPQQAKSSNKDDRMDSAKQAINQGQIQTFRATAESFDVAYITLFHQINGRTSRRDCIPNSRKLSPYEEEAIIQYILDLDLRGFPPRPRDVQEMANLLTERNGIPIGKNWTTNFTNRHLEIKLRFNRKYDYKRAKCEDLVIIKE